MINRKLLRAALAILVVSTLSLTGTVRTGADAAGYVPPPPDILERTAVPDSTPELSPYHPSNPWYGKYKSPPDLTQLRRAGRPHGDSFQSHRATTNHGGPYHDLFGTQIKEQVPTPANIGAYAVQRAYATLNVPSNSTLYAPTLIPSNAPRYEAFSAYDNFGPGTVRQFGVYDHKLGQFVNNGSVPKIINNQFLNTYTSLGSYRVIIQKYSSDWKVFLWNYTSSNWEVMAVGTGDAVNPAPYGWNIFEEYLGSCGGNIPQIESADLQVYTSGFGWQYVTATYGQEWKNFPHCSSSYITQWVNQFYRWKIDPIY